MGYVTREMIDRAKKMDLLTYLQTYEPQELVHFGGNTYCTREHDSLKISNGKWCWFSRGIGGKTALDYLIKVKELPFTEAVERIVGRAAERPSVFHARAQPEKPKTLLLPPKSNSNTRVIAYLKSRGIDGGLIEQCIRSGQLYESLPYHNAVFVGMDRNGTPRYACLRGIGTDFKGEATGSDKRFSFALLRAKVGCSAYSSRPSTCYLMPPWRRLAGCRGGHSICYPWPESISRKRKHRSTVCRWR